MASGSGGPDGLPAAFLKCVRNSGMSCGVKNS